jgi:hypothetical protein
MSASWTERERMLAEIAELKAMRAANASEDD